VNAASLALLELGQELQRRGYAFVTPTPETHRRVNARPTAGAGNRTTSLRDVFGWSRPFIPGALPARVVELMRAADILIEDAGRFRSRVRFSTLQGMTFVHSAFPTEQSDAVFFGPDTYRFCALLRRWAPRATRVVDIGCGSGAGGISLAQQSAQRVLADINDNALALAHINAALNGVTAEIVASDVLAGVGGEVDLVIANPPFLRDGAARLYREGGGAFGEALSLRIVRESLERLSRQGTLIVYTGSAIVDGVDTFLRAVTPLLQASGVQVDYEELDPDVFGEELERPDYAGVDRIAVVGLRARLG
jgi:release factor glutamine methyltransferase